MTTLSVTGRAWSAVAGDCAGRSASFRLPPMSSHANASQLPGPVSSLAEAVPAAVTEFARRLRWLGVDVSVSEVADALRAIRTLTCLTGNRLRGRLQVTLVKRSADIVTFQAAFDLLFPAFATRPQTAATGDGSPGTRRRGQARAGREPAEPDLLARLVALLRGDPGASAGELAAEVIGAYGRPGHRPGQPARSGITSTGSCASST